MIFENRFGSQFNHRSNEVSAGSIPSARQRYELAAAVENVLFRDRSEADSVLQPLLIPLPDHSALMIYGNEVMDLTIFGLLSM